MDEAKRKVIEKAVVELKGDFCSEIDRHKYTRVMDYLVMQDEYMICTLDEFEQVKAEMQAANKILDDLLENPPEPTPELREIMRGTWHERGGLPSIGSKWKHRNGNIYTVEGYANEYSESDKYPVTVIYVGDNGKRWCRPADDWLRSMTECTERDELVEKALSDLPYSASGSSRADIEALIDAGWRPPKN